MPNNSEDLIKLLKEKRQKLKLSQNRLSKKIGIAHTSVARIENGNVNPTLELFISMANQLGYDLILREIDADNINFLSNRTKNYSKVMNILLEETGFFNYKGRQSTVYNRFANNNIKTLEQLFELYDANKIEMGVDKLGENSYIHLEIKGIVELLKYEYLEIIPETLTNLLEYKIKLDYPITMTSYDYGYPGKVFKNVFKNKNICSETYSSVNQLYKILKSCGFDHMATKALIDLAYSKKLDNVSLGQFLSDIDIEEIKKAFSCVPQEYLAFKNILIAILKCYKAMMTDKKVVKAKH